MRKTEEEKSLGFTIGKRIKAIREKKGISRPMLAKLLDGLYSYDALYRLEERGIKSPPLNVIAKIADVLGVSFSDLIKDEDLAVKDETLSDPELTILMYEARDLSKKDRDVVLQVIKALKEKNVSEGKSGEDS